MKTQVVPVEAHVVRKVNFTASFMVLLLLGGVGLRNTSNRDQICQRIGIVRSIVQTTSQSTEGISRGYFTAGTMGFSNSQVKMILEG